jgi:hypothetical protein
MTLTEFLLARIAEDEENADDWHERFCATTGGPPGPFPCDCPVPDRVLVECKAKQQVVMIVQQWINSGVYPTLDHILFALALPYADHADYNQAWRQ